MERHSIYFEGLTQGEIIRLRRLALGLRQIDLASKAKCEVQHVVNLEKERWVRPDIKERILLALGLVEVIDDDLS